VPDLTELLELLRSRDPELRCRGVERAAVAVERLTHAVVASLETAGEHTHYVADHVHRFGTSMIDPLETLLERTRDDDTAVLCSLLLLRLHSRSGLERLIAAVRDGSPWSLQAATAFADVGIHEGVAPIVHRLRTVPLERAEEIVGLLRALQRLEHGLPADLAMRFERPEAPPAARALLGEALASTAER
jgi:hypothetical protein